MSNLPRVLEPEVMVSSAEARDYDAMDHADVNEAFCQALLARAHPPTALRRTLDVGVGTARIPVGLCRAAPEARVLGIDLSVAMLRVARRNVENAASSGVISLELADAKALPYPDGAFGCVVSNTVLHHIPEPADALCEMVRVLAPGGLLFVRDLSRPPDDRAARALVERVAAGATPLAKAQLDVSLRAALTLLEMQEKLRIVGLPIDAVSPSSDRHWTLSWVKPR